MQNGTQTDRRAVDAGRLVLIRPDLAIELTHGICVSNLCVRLGEELGLHEDHLYRLAQAGMMHDIGKLRLKEYVRGREQESLTIEEIRYVRLHADLGADILLSQGWDPDIASWVRHHHENMDGSGYPRRLKGEEIPLESRIIRVCDVFAALTTDRVYRGAFDMNTAIDMMIDDSRYYDIHVFLAFQKVIHDLEPEELKTRAETLAAISSILGKVST